MLNLNDVRAAVAFVALVLTLLSPLVALAAKDCSKSKSMAELKKCDPVEYERVQAILNQANAALSSSRQTIQQSEAALDQHHQTLKNVNEDLRQMNEDIKNRR